MEQWRAFRVAGRSSPPSEFPATPGGHGNGKCHDEEDSHDDKGKDPLQSNNLALELSDTNCCRKNGKGETHGVIIVDDDEKHAVGKNGPNENISEDSRNQVSGMGHHEGSVPVNGNKCPCKGSGNDWRVDEARIRVVAEVERRQIEKVENQDDFGPVKVRTNKEHHKGKVKEVVHDEVATDAGGGVNGFGVAGEEMRNITNLQDEENNPEDVGNDVVHGEGAGVSIVLVPNAPADGVAIVRSVCGVVDRDDKGQDPSDDGQELVSANSAGTVSLSLGEGIPVRHDVCSRLTRGWWNYSGCNHDDD